MRLFATGPTGSAKPTLAATAFILASIPLYLGRRPLGP